MHLKFRPFRETKERPNEENWIFTCMIIKIKILLVILDEYKKESKSFFNNWLAVWTQSVESSIQLRGGRKLGIKQNIICILSLSRPTVETSLHHQTLIKRHTKSNWSCYCSPNYMQTESFSHTPLTTEWSIIGLFGTNRSNKFKWNS